MQGEAELENKYIGLIITLLFKGFILQYLLIYRLSTLYFIRVFTSNLEQVVVGYDI